MPKNALFTGVFACVEAGLLLPDSPFDSFSLLSLSREATVLLS